MKQVVKSILELTPYRIVRDRGSNRFEAIDIALANLNGRGFDPKIIIDGGAHVGSFSLAAKSLFPNAAFHLIEPQSACHPQLRALCKQELFTLHECALGDLDGEIRISKTTEPTTGGHVVPYPGETQAWIDPRYDDSNTKTVPCRRLDTLFPALAPEHRTLLKLDLQGYELHALRGAAQSLAAIEVISTEVSFFGGSYEPPILDLMNFLNDFVLYDIAAISGRSRDNRAKQGDFIFVRKGSQLLSDRSWE